MTSSDTPQQPTVVQALAAVMSDIGAIGKDQKNTHQNYRFRGIDDVYNALHNPLAKHGVIILPEVEERLTDIRKSSNSSMNVVHLLVRYRFYGPAGDHLDVRVWGEGQDSADKATNKAMSAAMKYAILQTFAIPTDDVDEADRETVNAAPAHRQGSHGGQQEQPSDNDPGTIRSQIATVARAQGRTTGDVAQDFADANGGLPIGQANPPELKAFLAKLQSRNSQEAPA